jgi:hypothetical protein
VIQPVAAPILTTRSDDPRMFTGKERDSESGLDNFGAMSNGGSSLGRFISLGSLQLDSHSAGHEGGPTA